LGYDVRDCGAKEYNPEDDYPDFIIPVAKEVSHDPSHLLGIVIGGSGQGEAMCANKVYGIRAAVYYGGNTDIIRLSREHNDANVLSLGARFINPEDAKAVTKLWLDTKFSGAERHKRRIHKFYSVK
ncbi:MAG TPA: RpiB/LacA/LacB family sugar-phosphate isomerase, partial [Candidatus Paceibacterota bacterium]|nr:RpiB/LacA/LacB family sugar-phosphate isomerase [Candidatus Paceibacterota bacterium]